MKSNINLQNISFVQFDKTFLDKSYKWLHDKEIAELTNSSNFTKSEQQKWFQNLNNKTYFIKGIEYDKVAIGAVGLKNITKNSAEYWGYIGEKKYWGLGIGKRMLQYIKDYAQNLKINNLYLKVLNMNTRAVELYKNFGFITDAQKSTKKLRHMNLNLQTKDNTCGN